MSSGCLQLVEEEQWGCTWGCLLIRMSRTSEPSISYLRLSKTPDFSFESRRRAACTFPLSIRLEKDMTNLCSQSAPMRPFLDRCCWIVLPSVSKLSMSPADHASYRLSKQITWSFVFDVGWGFWSSNNGINMAALRATCSRAVLPQRQRRAGFVP